jgi:hypothetical protein
MGSRQGNFVDRTPHRLSAARYSFSLPDKIARGELRPLRNPALLEEAA